MTKRILSIVLTLLFAVSLLATFAVPASAAAVAFTVSPSVLISGGEYNIVWATNVNSVGYVKYTVGGKTYTVYDEENGVVRTDDFIHTVRVPQDHLDKAGSYSVVSKEVVSRSGYDITLGTSVETSRSFKGYNGKKDVTFAIMSDTHFEPTDSSKKSQMLSFVSTLMSSVHANADVVILNGDILDDLSYEADYYGLFEFFTAAGGNGTKPILYTIGNHEKRGFYSKEIEKYLVFDTGEFYTRVDYGPVSMLVLDGGEDKEDNLINYGYDGSASLVDGDHYYEQQLNWLESIEGYNDDADYKFSVSHSPYFMCRDYLREDFYNVMTNFGTEFHVGGHVHGIGWKTKYGNAASLMPVPVLLDGAPENNVRFSSSSVTCSNGGYTIRLYDTGGSFKQEIQYGTDGNSAAQPQKQQATQQNIQQTTQSTQTTVQNDITVTVPTKAGISTSTVKSAAGTTAFVTSPVVFDCGYYYSVVWQTTAGTKAAGYVEVSGSSKVWNASHGAKLRTETTHSVRIPKETLAGKSYTVKSRIVGNYNAYGFYGGGDVDYGPFVTGSAVKMAALPGSKASKFTVLAVANKTGGKAAAQELLATYKTVPNLLVMLGDMAPALNTEADFGKYILEYAAEVTGGKYPVVFCRGEGEAKGEFAANLARFIRVFTGDGVTTGLYNDYAYGGNFSFISLDTATKNADSYAAYNGFANFDSLKQKQAEWLQSGVPNSLKSNYNLVFANATNITNCAGVDFTTNFENLGTHLVVSAGSGSAQLADGGSAYSQAVVGDALGLVITCAKQKIKVESISGSLSTIGEVDVDAIDYKGEIHTPGLDDSQSGSSGSQGGSGSGGSSGSSKPSGSGGSTSGDGNYVAGDFNGIDGSLYIDDVEEGWYLDHLTFDIEITDDDITFAADVNDGEFIYVVARYCGVNDSIYSGDTNSERASAWAQEIGIISSSMSGEGTVSASSATAVVQAIFA